MDIEPFGDIGADGARDTAGLEFLASLDDAGEGFITANTQDFLRNNGTFVEIRRDEMRCDADNLDAALVGLAIGVRTGKGGEE